MNINNNNDENIVLAYKCKMCGSLYNYDVNNDKVHKIFDYMRSILSAILIFYLIYIIIMDLIK